MRAALFSRVRQLLANRATSDLFDRFPDLSARIVANAWQGSVVGRSCWSRFRRRCGSRRARHGSALHFFFSFFFLACVGLRFAALLSAGPQRSRATAGRAWPPTCRSIRCSSRSTRKPTSCRTSSRRWTGSTGRKASSRSSSSARRTISPRSPRFARWRCRATWRSSKCRCSGRAPSPRRSPMRCRSSSGEFVALYDAEDHPHPMQLLQAWQKFRDVAAGTRLRPGAARNRQPRQQASVALMFAFEYAALFRGLLPWLSSEAAAPAARRHLQPFPPRRAGGGRRLGSLQRHRGRRSRRQAGAFRLPHRDHLLPDLRGRARYFRNMAAAAHPLVQGLDADLAGPHARSFAPCCAISASVRS